MIRGVKRITCLIGIAFASFKLFAAPPNQIIDKWGWINNISPQEVAVLARKETERAMRQLNPLEEQASAIKNELKSRLDYKERTAPAQFGKFQLFTETPRGTFWPKLLMKRNLNNSEPICLLDLKKLANETGYVDIGGYAISSDGKYLAYSIDTIGNRRYQLRLLDIKHHHQIVISENSVSSFDFSNDGSKLYYVEIDQKKRPYLVKQLNLFSRKSDTLFQEKDELFRVAISLTQSRNYLQIISASASTSEVHLLDQKIKQKDLVTVLKRKNGVYYEVEDWNDTIYIRTNEGNLSYRITKLPYTKLGNRKYQQEVFAGNSHIQLVSLKAFKKALTVLARQENKPVLYKIDPHSDTISLLNTPADAELIEYGTNPNYAATAVRLIAQSFLMPSTVFDINLSTNNRKAIFTAQIPPEINLSAYCASTIQANSADGTAVPIKYVYRGDCSKPPQNRPMLVSVYGAYGAVFSPTFSLNRFTLLDRGFVIAMAQVRGGGEFGDNWYYKGRGEYKYNSMKDFKAAVETLQNMGFSSPGKTILSGASAGGLVVASVINDTPGLAAGMVLKGAFLDVSTTMADPTLPNTIPEYLEWGNPNEKSQLAYMKSYDPYLNIHNARYPKSLIEIGLHDEQVSPKESLKYAFKLRDTIKNPNDILLIADPNSGHDGAADADEFLKQLALEMAFIIDTVSSSESSTK